jgi:hypothetical protein
VLRRYNAAVLATPDALSLAEALTGLEGAVDVGSRGRAMVATEFSWERVIADLIHQLETLGLTR